MTTNLLEYLESAAARFPDKTAFTDESESVTFAELRSRAVASGAAIASEVKSVRKPVAVLTRHAARDLAYFFGALYAGCFYVPVDAEAPPEYVAARIAAVNPALVIDPETFERGAYSAYAEPPGLLATGTDPAYAIFTSGSSGTPKAAVISHAALINLTEWMCGEFGFDERTVFGGQTPFYFDASVPEIYCTLRAAATTHLLPRKLFFSPLKVMRYLDERRVNTIKWASAAIKLTANSGVLSKYAPQYLETVMFGGEAMTGKHLNVWRRALPEARYVNLYGPTETTVDCAYYVADRDFADGDSIPVGKPVANTEIILLDGEIAVRGVCVGLGYLGDPERTDAAFVQNPRNTAYRDVVYLTGDLAEYNDRGELVCRGRRDSQVKHMGSRVELGEIETAAASLGGVELCACGYDAERGKILLFYQGAADCGAVSDALREKLPRYMLPGDVIKREVLPSLSNDKIDRARLMREYYASAD
ncbi:MAG: AMP-binding protein [Oscillospiraceae bacterium]|nr:AMP-binding protein [Oscillospiraceae bacterium]